MCLVINIKIVIHQLTRICPFQVIFRQFLSLLKTNGTRNPIGTLHKIQQNIQFPIEHLREFDEVTQRC